MGLSPVVPTGTTQLVPASTWKSTSFRSMASFNEPSGFIGVTSATDSPANISPLRVMMADFKSGVDLNLVEERVLSSRLQIVDASRKSTSQRKTRRRSSAEITSSGISRRSAVRSAAGKKQQRITREGLKFVTEVEHCRTTPTFARFANPYFSVRPSVRLF